MADEPERAIPDAEPAAEQAQEAPAAAPDAAAEPPARPPAPAPPAAVAEPVRAPGLAGPSTEVMPTASAISISAHPRAVRMVRRAREMGGLAGFLVGGWMSLHTHSFPEAALRAVIAGLVCQVIVWAAAVLLSRYLIIAELHAREHALVQAVRSGRDRGGVGEARR
jgi:hypothetical protein